VTERAILNGKLAKGKLFSAISCEKSKGQSNTCKDNKNTTNNFYMKPL